MPLAVGHEHCGSDEDCEQEVRRRSGRHDERSLTQGLGAEGDTPFLRGQYRPANRLSRVAEHAHITAERDYGDLPPRSGPVGPAPELPAEAHGKDLDPNAAAPRRPVMTELVHEDEHAQKHQEWDQIFPKKAQPGASLARTCGCGPLDEPIRHLPSLPVRGTHIVQPRKRART